MRSHIDPVTLIDYARGRLSRRQAAGVREHCVWCTECGDQLAAVLVLRRAAGNVQKVTPALSPGWAAAAAVVLAVGAGAFALVSMESGPDTSASASVAMAEREQSAARASEDLADLRQFLEPLRHALGSVAKVADGEPDQVAVLRTALERLDDGDLDGMATALAPFGDRFDAWGTPLLGIAHYLGGDDSEETVGLLRASTTRYVGSDPELGYHLYERMATWYLARLERDRGHLEEADALLRSVAGLDDRIGKWARRELGAEK